VRAILALGALLTPSAVAAQDLSGQQVREVGQRYATCVIRRAPNEARRFLVVPGKRPPVIGDCLNEAARGMGNEMRFPGAMYRYAMAEALIVRDYTAGLPDGVAAATPPAREEPETLDEAKLPKGKRGEEVRQRFVRAQGFHVLDTLTECVARTNPQGSLALLKTGLGNTGETAAFAALKPAIAGCLPPGQTVNFNRTVLRGSLAFNLYRLAYAVRPVA
jgi:hypothetical protein